MAQTDYYTPFLEETNYDPARYSQGYDIKFKDEDTIQLLEYTKDLLLEGVYRCTVTKALREEVGIPSYRHAEAITNKATKMIMIDTKEAIRKVENINRLDYVYRQAMATGNLKEATNALKEMDRICGFDVQKVEVGGEGQFTFQLGNVKE